MKKLERFNSNGKVVNPDVSIYYSYQAKKIKGLLEVFKPIIPNEPFPYSLNTSENLLVFWCFQGVEKECIGDKWVNW